MEIKINSCCYEYDTAKSFYNHNYYKLKNYGDWFYSYWKKDLYLYEVCHEEENCYSDSIGYFECEKFVELFCCTNTNSALE